METKSPRHFLSRKRTFMPGTSMLITPAQFRHFRLGRGRKAIMRELRKKEAQNGSKPNS